MLTAWYFLIILLTPFGLALLAVGVIVRLVEWSWDKGTGGYGSTGPLAAAGLLCLPLLALPVTWLLAQVTR